MNLPTLHPSPPDAWAHALGFAARTAQHEHGRCVQVYPRRPLPQAVLTTACVLQSHVTRRLGAQLLQAAVCVSHGLPSLRGGDLLIGCIDRLEPGVSLLGREGRRLPAVRGDLVVLCLAEVDDDAGVSIGQSRNLNPGAWLDLVGENGLVIPQRLRGGGAAVLGRVRAVGRLVDELGQPLRLPSTTPMAGPARVGRTAMPELVLFGTRASAVAGVSRTLTDVMAALRDAGQRVGICRVNTTGRGTLPSDLIAAGALAVVDLVDAGCSRLGTLPLSALERLCSTLFQELAARGAELVLIEADDGLDQPEISALLMSHWFRSRLSAVLLSQERDEDVAPRCEWLDRLGLRIWTDTRRCLRHC